ncbi:hypothetical protein ACGFNV_31605 [Streptomyces sp. NPDC048751]|uniref:hypothetical protein n=1 Tax=Streptomyces sp. NPDC048751 TaxID=3365591 RepID=UPI00371BC298
MPTLPAWRVASSALCAALLVGITGPAAVAADPAREHSHAASPHVRFLSTDAVLAQARTINGGELTPVADLLQAVFGADHGRPPVADARKLGAAAKAALAKAAAKAPAALVTPKTPAPGIGVLLPAPAVPAAPAVAPASDDPDTVENELDAVDEALDTVEEALDDLEDAVDSLLDAITSGDEDEVLPTADDLLTELADLIDALTGGGLPLLPTLSGTSTPTSLAPTSLAPTLLAPTSSTPESSTPDSSTEVSSTQVTSVSGDELPTITMSNSVLLPAS